MIIHVIVRHKPVPVFGREKASALPRKFLIFVVPVVKDAKENQTCRRTSNNQIQQNEALERLLSLYFLFLISTLFAVSYYSVGSSRSSGLRYWWPS